MTISCLVQAKKFHKRLFLLPLCGLMIILCYGFVSAQDTILKISELKSITGALAAIPQQAENVVILLDARPSEKEAVAIGIPTDKGIKSLSIEKTEEMSPVMIRGIDAIYANGIPFTLGAGILLKESSLYGGAHASAGETVEVASSLLRCLGQAGYLFGGGFAEGGGHSRVTGESRVELGKEAVVFYELFGGGHAAGEGSVEESGSSRVLVQGTADYVLGGSFAEAGASVSCGASDITIEASGQVLVGLFGGGSASGTGSRSVTGSARIQLHGEAEMAFCGDFAFGGGTASLLQSGRLEVLQGAHCREAVAGSFAVDQGSQAEIDTAELMICGSADTLTLQSHSASGSQARTRQSANFPCR